MIGLPRAGLPRRLLARQHDRQTIGVGNQAAVPLFVEGKQASLVSQQLAHRDGFLAVLGELRPVAGNTLFVIEPAARMRQRQRHRRQALGRRVDENHGVFLPGLAGRLVAHAAPQVDDLPAPVVHATRAAQFVAQGEIVGECIAHGLEARTHVPFDANVLWHFH